jgi:hypothetical protein
MQTMKCIREWKMESASPPTFIQVSLINNNSTFHSKKNLFPNYEYLPFRPGILRAFPCLLTIIFKCAGGNHFLERSILKTINFSTRKGISIEKN